MQNEEGQGNATNRLITSKDHASVQLNIGHLDADGIYTGQFTTLALRGFVRAQLWDMRTLTLIKTYTSGVPVNAVSMSPLLDHVVIGGGQDASAVTTTDHRAGNFEAKFYDKILQEEIGGVKGHFGPINALAFNPDGRSFSSGGEDGYVRLHHFDSDYFSIKI
ncbi:hypothetical protein F2Q68_00036354 [Brassica cretica]|uniref:Serine-threonine kinase receptor-associated protein n=1 Tax=Brassica cretica TaxID=69181 RepID=A0A8S9H4P5_BRACR|nr:hypothetical protein F2Q68_00036354 [Brassica cretica]